MKIIERREKKKEGTNGEKYSKEMAMIITITVNALAAVAHNNFYLEILMDSSR